MVELAFLTLILLINYRIPHVLIEFHECYFLAKNKGQSYPLTQGAKVSSNYASPRSHHMDWRARQWSKPMYQTLRNRENTKGIFLEAYWSRSLTRGWAHWSAKPTDQPTRAPLNRPSFLVGNFLEISLWQFKVPHAQKLTRIAGEPPL